MNDRAVRQAPRVAIVHYWLIDRRGGERVLECLCELYPQADIFTNVYVPEAFEGSPISRHRIRTTFVNKLPRASVLIAQYLALMPMALRRLKLSKYDLIISSESGPSKGVRSGPGAVHICYCHSPMRYIWDMYPQYLRDVGIVERLLMRPIASYLRRWDSQTAKLPHAILANSSHTKLRVETYWHRESKVLHPPVDLQRFSAVTSPATSRQYYLFAGHLMPYKRADLAIRAFAELDLPLVIAGTGPDLVRLARKASKNVRFTGWVSDEEMVVLMSGARALIHPGIEDFGIVPLEAMAAGTPVIAFRGGGALDSVIEGTTGLFFDEQTPDSLAAVVRHFEETRNFFDSQVIRDHAHTFDRGTFLKRFEAAVTEATAALTERSFT